MRNVLAGLFDESLRRFYNSLTYEMMRDGVSDMHCMSVPYIVQDVIDGEQCSD